MGTANKNSCSQYLNTDTSTTRLFSMAYLYTGIGYCLFPQYAYAASIDKADSTWGPLTKFVLNLFTGDPAIIASLVAFLMGIAVAMRTQHKIAALGGGLAVALAFQLGPNLVEHLSGGTI